MWGLSFPLRNDSKKYLGVNYSWRASKSCILLAALGKYAVYISSLLLRMCVESFVVWHTSLSWKIWFHMPAPCSTKWNIIKHTIFQGHVKVGGGQVKFNFHLPYCMGKSLQNLMLCPDGLTLMLMVANLVQKNDTKNFENDWNPGIRVLSESYPRNTNMTGFKW